MARSAYHEAVAHFEQGLNALPSLPGCRQAQEQAIDLRIDLRNALLPLDEHERILDVLEPAESLATTLNDPQRLARILFTVSITRWSLGDHSRVIASAQRLLTLAATSQDAMMHHQGNGLLIGAYMMVGQYRQALDAMREQLLFLESQPIDQYLGRVSLAAVHDRFCLTWCQAELGNFAEGIAYGNEAIQIAEGQDHPFSLSQALGGMGLLYLRQGDLAKAISTLERGLDLCQRFHFAVFIPRTASALSLAYALSACFPKARSLWEEIVEQAPSIGSADRVLIITSLSESAFLSERPKDALDLAGQALLLARQRQEQGHEAWILRLLGAIYMHRDWLDVNEAKTHYEGALTLANALDMRPLQAHCHLGLGTLHSQTGQAEQARAELTTAIEMYRDMEMTFWLPETEAAMAEVEGR